MKLILGFAFLFVLSMSAWAQPACGPKSEVKTFLTSEHKEKQIAIGLSKNGSLVELFTKQDGSTWSILITTPGGMACLVLMGEHWEQLVWRTATSLRKRN